MRLLVGICILFLAFTAPWWWVLVLLCLAIFLFQGYPEAFIVFSLMIVRMYPHMVLSDRILWLGALFIAWLLLAFVSRQLQNARDSQLYA